MNRKLQGLLAIFFSVFVLYFFLFPVPLGPELLIRPSWKADFPRKTVPPVSSVVEPDRLGLVRGGTVGFLSGDGRPVFAEEISYDASVSDTMFINYPQLPEALYLKDSSGRILCKVPEKGYPILRQDRLFVLTTDRSGISEWSIDGRLLWRREFVSLITDIVVSPSYVLIGLLEGAAFLLDGSGSEVAVMTPSGSRLPAVYGCAVSPNEKLIGIVSGLDPQRVTLYENTKGRFRPVAHRDLSGDFRRRVLASFSNDSRFLFFETPEGISRLDVKTMGFETFAGTGRLLQIIPFLHDSVLLLAKDDGPAGRTDSEIRGMLPPGLTFFRMDLPGSSPFFRYREQSLFFGADTAVMKIDLVEG